MFSLLNSNKIYSTSTLILPNRTRIYEQQQGTPGTLTRRPRVEKVR